MRSRPVSKWCVPLTLGLLVGGGTAMAKEIPVAPGLSEVPPDPTSVESEAPLGRDPFKRLSFDEPGKTVLELVPLSSLRLRAMLWSVGEPRAIVSTREGAGSEHVLSVGTRVGRQGGIVTEIDGRCVRIEEEQGKDATREMRRLCLHFAQQESTRAGRPGER